MKEAMKPGYKHTALGWIPKEWEVRSLGEVFTFKNGINAEKESYGSGVKFINVMEVINNECITLDKIPGSVQVPEKLRKLYKVNNGDVLFNRTSETYDEIGLAAVFSGDEDVVFGGFVIRGQETLSVLDNLFKRYCFRGKVVRDRIIKGGQGVIRSNIGQGDLEKVQFALPPLPEQRKIASILSTWDAAIAAESALIAALQSRHRALMQRLLSGKVRLKGFAGDWNKIKAREIFKSSSKKNNGNEPLLSATQERSIIPRDMLEGRVTMPSDETGSYKLVESGDFVISLRSFQGGLEYSEYRGLVSPAYTVLKPVKPISNDFYRFYFKSPDFISRLSVAVIGIRDGKQISYDDFAAIKLPNPSLEEQDTIASILTISERGIVMHKEHLAALQVQKKGLMQVLLTGKKRVTIN